MQGSWHILLAGYLLWGLPGGNGVVQEVHCEKLELNEGDGEVSSRGLQLILWVYDDDLGYTISHWLWWHSVPETARWRRTSAGWMLIWTSDGLLRVIHAKRRVWTFTADDPEVTEQQFDGKNSADRNLWQDWGRSP